MKLCESIRKVATMKELCVITAVIVLSCGKQQHNDNEKPNETIQYGNNELHILLQKQHISRMDIQMQSIRESLACWNIDLPPKSSLETTVSRDGVFVSLTTSEAAHRSIDQVLKSGGLVTKRFALVYSVLEKFLMDVNQIDDPFFEAYKEHNVSRVKESLEKKGVVFPEGSSVTYSSPHQVLLIVSWPREIDKISSIIGMDTRTHQ